MRRFSFSIPLQQQGNAIGSLVLAVLIASGVAATAQETVIMSREKDKVWRVAGYYIK